MRVIRSLIRYAYFGSNPLRRVLSRARKVGSKLAGPPVVFCPPPANASARVAPARPARGRGVRFSRRAGPIAPNSYAALALTRDLLRDPYRPVILKPSRILAGGRAVSERDRARQRNTTVVRPIVAGTNRPNVGVHPFTAKLSTNRPRRCTVFDRTTPTTVV